MRFMMLMIPGGYEKAPPGQLPDRKAIEKMMKYNEELGKAGVLLALDGLHPPSMGARVSFPGGKPRVTDGPFAEAKEVLGGCRRRGATNRSVPSRRTLAEDSLSASLETIVHSRSSPE